MKKTAIKKLLLAGGGHAHIGLLRRLPTNRQTGTDITLISEQPYSIYSGMLPGWMAGHYDLAEISIDIKALCQKAKVRFVPACVGQVIADANKLVTTDKQSFDYDLLSLNTGADTAMQWLNGDVDHTDTVVPIRPLHHFVERWQQILIDAQQPEAYRLAVVGAGAAATELVMAAKFALQSINSNHKISLVCGDELLADFDKNFKRRVIKQLDRHNIEIIYARAKGYSEGRLLTTAQSLNADAVIAATGVTGAAWTRDTDIKTVEDGFIAVNSAQQSVSHPNVFAVGDTSTRVDKVVAHSGVHAVFGGRVEADNLLAYLNNAPLQDYQPKKRTLYLLSCGDKYAIGSWGRYSLQGRWVWELKRQIDKRFVEAS